METIIKGTTFQVLSRNNDKDGNPFRLILSYSKDGRVVEAAEARSSCPNYVGEHHRLMRQLPTFHLSPSEYNTTKKCFADILKRVN